MHLTMDQWKLTDWLQNTEVFYANLFKNFFLGLSIENRPIYNFLSQIIFTYNKRNKFLIPNFMQDNYHLFDFRKSFKQNLKQSKISNYFINWTFEKLKRVIYFSFLNKKSKIKPCVVIAVENEEDCNNDNSEDEDLPFIKKKSFIPKKKSI